MFLAKIKTYKLEEHSIDIANGIRGVVWLDAKGNWIYYFLTSRKIVLTLICVILWESHSLILLLILSAFYFKIELRNFLSIKLNVGQGRGEDDNLFVEKSNLWVFPVFIMLFPYIFMEFKDSSNHTHHHSKIMFSHNFLCRFCY